MAKMSLGEFQERYREHRAIAAMAVVVEDEAKGKKRIIHDATHGLRMNHRIKCRDKIRSRELARCVSIASGGRASVLGADSAIFL